MGPHHGHTKFVVARLHIPTQSGRALWEHFAANIPKWHLLNPAEKDFGVNQIFLLKPMGLSKPTVSMFYVHII